MNSLQTALIDSGIFRRSTTGGERLYREVMAALHSNDLEYVEEVIEHVLSDFEYSLDEVMNMVSVPVTPSTDYNPEDYYSFESYVFAMAANHVHNVVMDTLTAAISE